ncbi:hypothetical protein PRIPAC_72384 [Pristionchus pacificus]|uniref:Uncharacterized protein n=1 Tax=Pristionchus pacificus TaxID=54126 RepID=A0A2A6CFZ2_PRIPA|nr:hypothetical protein PRIPAC_72384 [Pristionchus pacificus]|eukprot:PDM77008.1 hypothetical protein PRIPAC_42403 [Pristionchus pacificus]
MRKQRRLAAVLRGSKCLPNVSPVTFVPPFRTKQELHTLDTLCDHPDYKKQSRYVYQCEQEAATPRHWRHDNDRRRSTETPKKKEWVEKQGTVTEMAQLALKDGAYMATVDTVTAQLKTRELLTHNKFMVNSMARMKMCTVKREKEAENLREALQEWIEDARIVVQLHDENSSFSIVSMIDEDETREGRKKEKKEEKEVKKEDKKKKNKKNKNKDNTENVETKKEDEKEVEPESEVTSLSFCTRFYGVDYSIKVEMRNDEDVHVKTLPVLKGIDKKITDILAVSTLLDAVTFEFWKAMVA